MHLFKKPSLFFVSLITIISLFLVVSSLLKPKTNFKNPDTISNNNNSGSNINEFNVTDNLILKPPIDGSDFNINNITTSSPTSTITNPIYNNSTESLQQSSIVDSTISIHSLTDDIISQVNDLRSSLGLSSLKQDSVLTNIAQFRAEHMGTNNYFSHNYNGESHYQVVATMFNYKGSKIGENIAYNKGYKDSEVADITMKSWIESKGHYDNMIDPTWTNVGIGIYEVNKEWYFVQIFGSE